MASSSGMAGQNIQSGRPSGSLRRDKMIRPALVHAHGSGEAEDFGEGPAFHADGSGGGSGVLGVVTISFALS
jgi:hypothetical protein